MPPLSQSTLNRIAKWNDITCSKDIYDVRGIKLAAWNICSLYRKIDDVNVVLNNSGLHYMGISESWLNVTVSDNELMIPGYSIHRLDRNSGITLHGGGGVLAYCSDKYEFQQLTEISLCTPDIEMIWSKLSLRGTKPTFISTIYRPPMGNVVHFLEMLELYVMKLVDTGPCDIVIMGDMNIDVKQPRATNTKNYLNTCKRLGLTQLVQDFTRVTMMSKSAIDHIWVSNEELYPRAGVINPGASDHSMVFTSRKRDKLSKEHEYIECRSYRDFSPMCFQRDVNSIQWDDLFQMT